MMITGDMVRNRNKETNNEPSNSIIMLEIQKLKDSIAIESSPNSFSSYINEFKETLDLKLDSIESSPNSFSSYINELKETLGLKLDSISKSNQRIEFINNKSLVIQKQQLELDEEIQYNKEHDYNKKKNLAAIITKKKEEILHKEEEEEKINKPKSKWNSLLGLGSLLLIKLIKPYLSDITSYLKSFFTGSLLSWLSEKAPLLLEMKSFITDKFTEEFLPWIKKNSSFIIEPIKNWIDKKGFKFLIDSSSYIRKAIFSLLTSTVYPWIRDHGIDFLKNSVIPLGDKFLKYVRNVVWPTFLKDIFPQIKENIGTIIKGLAIGYIFLNPIKSLKLVISTLAYASSFLLKNVIKGSLIGLIGGATTRLIGLTSLIKRGSIAAKELLFNQNKSKTSGMGGMLDKIKSGKIGKGIGSLLKLFKPLLRAVPFLGLVLTVYDILDTIFPNIMSDIGNFISQIPSKLLELGGSIWDSISLGISSIVDWFKDKFKLIPNFFETVIRSYPLIGNKIADHIFLNKSEVNSKRIDTNLRTSLETKLTNSKAIDGDTIKDWKEIKKLSIRDLSLLSSSTNITDSDIKKIASILLVKQKKKVTEEAKIMSDSEKLTILKKGNDILLKRVEIVQSDNSIPLDRKNIIYEGINKAIQANLQQQKVLKDSLDISKITSSKVTLNTGGIYNSYSSISKTSNKPNINHSLEANINTGSDSINNYTLNTSNVKSSYNTIHSIPNKKESNDRLYDYVLKTESFSPTAKWDYKQWSNGYGTKAKSKDEVIDEPTAMKRFKTHIDHNMTKVEAFVPNETPLGLIHALTSLSYNSGYRWMRAGLGKAVKKLDYDDIETRFKQYNKVTNKQGVLEESKGLTNRRIDEISWLKNDISSDNTSNIKLDSSSYNLPTVLSNNTNNTDKELIKTKSLDITPLDSAEASKEPIKPDLVSVGSSSASFNKPNRDIDRVFLHCSASDKDEDDSVKVITQWHKKRGFSTIGYHYFIHKNGNISKGRNINKIPAAQKGNNTGTIAICIHGLSDFTTKQMNSLKSLCGSINNAYKGNISFHGHCEVSNKSCPVFDYSNILNLVDSKIKGYKNTSTSIPINTSSIPIDTSTSIPIDTSTIHKDTSTSIPIDTSTIHKDNSESYPHKVTSISSKIKDRSSDLGKVFSLDNIVKKTKELSAKSLDFVQTKLSKVSIGKDLPGIIKYIDSESLKATQNFIRNNFGNILGDESESNVNKQILTDVNKQTPTNLLDKNKSDVNKQILTNLLDKNESDVNKQTPINLLDKNESNVNKQILTNLLDKNESNVNKQTPTNLLDKNGSGVNKGLNTVLKGFDTNANKIKNVKKIEVDVATSDISRLTNMKLPSNIMKETESKSLINVNQGNKEVDNLFINLESSKLMNESLSLIGDIL